MKRCGMVLFDRALNANEMGKLSALRFVTPTTKAITLTPMNSSKH